MTKADLAKEVYEKQDGHISKKQALQLVELVFKTLKKTLVEENMVKIAGFGTFIVKKRWIRKGRNIKTGEEIPLEPRKVVTFKASLKFREKVDSQK